MKAHQEDLSTSHLWHVKFATLKEVRFGITTVFDAIWAAPAQPCGPQSQAPRKALFAKKGDWPRPAQFESLRVRDLSFGLGPANRFDQAASAASVGQRGSNAKSKQPPTRSPPPTASSATCATS